MDRNTPLYDGSLSDQERANWLISQMTLDEKCACFTLGIHIDRLGIHTSTCGGEGAHGVQARAGQHESYPPTPTTSFTQPIGMAATFDRDLIRTPRTYRYFAEPVLYPFGYGLSYTTFAYSGLSVQKNEDKTLTVSVKVKNTGDVCGDEVAQLYIQRVSPSATVHPLRRLIGFERLHDLMPGEERRAEFTVRPCDMSIYVEEEGRKLVEPGRYRIYAGGCCLDERVSAEI